MSLTPDDLNEKIERLGDRLDELRIRALMHLIGMLVALISVAVAAGGSWALLEYRVGKLESRAHGMEHELQEDSAWWRW